ncbi:MAG: restriction endonuclease subunit S [Armatimonadetes bacterium]|nr:restriction endonuclease subunit S [Armatimonadota bacterium]
MGIVPDWPNVVVTGHFAIYEADALLLAPEYFIRLIQTNFFKAYLWRNKVGAEGRKEVKLDFFESIAIPLPSLQIQRAIVDRWERAAKEELAAIQGASDLEAEMIEHILEEAGIVVHPLRKKPNAFAIINRDLHRWGVEFNRWAWSLDGLLSSTKYPTVPLSAVTSINPTVDHELTDDDLVTFVPMSAVSDTTGQIESSELRPLREVKSGYTRFAESDVIWAKITPCMQNGKCAVARNLKNGVGYGSTEFHVVRIREDVNLLPDYVWLLLRLERVRYAAQRYFTGSAGQQRVPAEFLEELHVPLPPVDVQNEILTRVQIGYAEVARLRTVADQIRAAANAEIEAMILGTLQVRANEF